MSRRAVVWASIVASIAALLVLLAITLDPPTSRPSAPDREVTASVSVDVAVAPTSVQPPAISVASAPSKPTTAPTSVAPSGSAGADDHDPDDGAWRTLKPGDLAAGDLFDDPDAPRRARKLRSIGSITVGVMSDAKVHDEHALAAALVEGGRRARRARP